jgi:formylglycine-generating enzyme required for sulfatase activity
MAELSFEVVTVDEQGQEIARRRGTAQSFVEQLPGGVGLEMVAIPGGKFQIEDEGSAQYEVTVSPFFLGRYTVTQAQWKALMSMEQRELEINPPSFKGGDRPVGQVSWLT